MNVMSKLEIAECLRTYAMLFSELKEENIKQEIIYVNFDKQDNEVKYETLLERFSKIIARGDTCLKIEDFNKMVFTKGCYSVSKIFSYAKDIFNSGLINNLDWEEDVFYTKSELNKKCAENFTTKDIIKYIRDALNHNDKDNPLYWITTDNNGDIKIHIKLKLTKATKGIDKEKTVPFEVEITKYDLLYMAILCMHTSSTFCFGGICFKKDIPNFKCLNNKEKLKKIIENLYYTYDIYRPIGDKDKKKLNGNLKNTRNILERKLEKRSKKELSIFQKQTIYKNMLNYLTRRPVIVLGNEGLVFDPAEITKDSEAINENIPLLYECRLEYEGLKCLPICGEKRKNHLVSYIISDMLLKHNGNISVVEAIDTAYLEFIGKGTGYKWFSMVTNIDKEEENMFIAAINDIDYQDLENHSIYYSYMLDSLITDDEILIGDKYYKKEKLRDAFVHGRWYYNSAVGNWELYDCKNGIRNQFNFNWHKSISSKDMQDAMEMYYQKLCSQTNSVNRGK